MAQRWCYRSPRRRVGLTPDMWSMSEPGAYRWIVVGVSTAVNALAWGARSTFALFYVAMLEEFAWGRGPTALGYSLSWLCFVVFAPAAGWLYDRWGARTVVTMDGYLRSAPWSQSSELAVSPS
jgi:hypothetical protein